MTRPGDADLAAWLSGRSAIDVVPLRHPILEAIGHHPTSDYGEQFWLSVIGPSALWAYRKLTAGFPGAGLSGYQMELSDFGRELGLGAGIGRHAPVVRTLTRLADFHLAELVDGRFGVHVTLPPLTHRQAARLPDSLAARHREASLRRFADTGTRGVITAEVGP